MRQREFTRERAQNHREFTRDRAQHSITCYCCGREGHIARMCDLRCSNCGRRGHKANRCLSRQQPSRNNLRLLEESENEWFDDDVSTAACTAPEENDEEVNEQEAHCVNTVHMEDVVVTSRTPIQKRKENGYNSKKTVKLYPEEVNQWSDFIEGRTNKKPKTLISTNHSEKAANKPLIEGRCQGRLCKILCDSGAEVNVIDEALVKRIQEKDVSVEVSKSKKSVKCANNSSMEVVGSVRLRMSFATTSKTCTFVVVKDLFPKVILGIRSMKGLRMIIDPANSRVKVRGETIPFLSKVYAETVVAQGNEEGSVLGVGGRQM